MMGGGFDVSKTMPPSSPPQPVGSTALIPSKQRTPLFMNPSTFSYTSPWVDGSPAILGS
jgi:hypothetical protein